MVVETVNESVLVMLMEQRETPVPVQETFRDIDKDWAQHQAEQCEEATP